VSSLHICLLGNPQIEIGGQTVPVPRRKVLALLAYLAVTGRVQSRESLAALFWPDYDQSHAYANLRRDLSRLKELFGEESVLAVDRLQVGLDPGVELELDVTAFQALVNKTKIHRHSPDPSGLCSECFSRLKEAVELYQGDFMAGFHLPDSPGFDDWRFFQSEEQRQLLADALHWTGFTNRLTAA
jgi:DNA-binding SARP family transcriptional activator